MDKYICFCDTTLRDGEQTPGVHFSPAQKLEIARRLEKMGVDVIEAGFPASSPGDAEAVALISEKIERSTVSAIARLVREDIDAAAEALRAAKKKRLHVFIATSDIHIENKLKTTREDVLRRIVGGIEYAANLGSFDEIEFSAEDATRTDGTFLEEAVRCAADAGADIINIPDTVGYATPTEISEIIRALKPKIGECAISVHCHNDLGFAVSNSLAALEAGATQVECTVNGLGERAGNAALEEVSMALSVRRERFGFSDGLIREKITGTSRFVSSVSGVAVPPNKAVVGANAFAHASGIHQHGVMNSRETYEIMRPEEIGLTSGTIVLGKLSGRHAFAERVGALGYTLDSRGIDAAFARFKEIADRKATIVDEDIRAIVGEYLDSIEGKYRLAAFQIQSGNHMKAMALVTLLINGTEDTLTEAAPGSGPIDAAFNAINRIVGADCVELVSYGITAVTEGTDALGEAKVKIKSGKTVYTGRGVSTDVIKASIKAYISAVNKWVNSTRRI